VVVTNFVANARILTLEKCQTVLFVSRIMVKTKQMTVESWKHKGWEYIRVGGKVYINVKNFQKVLDELKLLLKTKHD